MSAIVNITTKSDADFRRQFLYHDSSDVPISLAGKSMRMVIRSRAEDANLRAEVSTAAGTIEIIPETTDTVGRFWVIIPKATLIALQPGIYVHSLVLFDSSGATVKIWDGTLTHSAGPTR